MAEDNITVEASCETLCQKIHHYTYIGQVVMSSNQDIIAAVKSIEERVGRTEILHEAANVEGQNMIQRAIAELNGFDDE